MVDLSQLIIETAADIGASPLDLATAISYETAGTFDPLKRGPTTQHGQHRGLIQFGEPQAARFGVDWSDPIGSQLGKGKAVSQYFKASGFKPGMSGLDLYSTINAGSPGRYGASDANNGGAPGDVRDKWENQMAGHRQKAQSLLGDYANMADGPKGQEMYPSLFGSMAPGGGFSPPNNSIDPNVAAYAFGEEGDTWGSRLQNAGKAFDQAANEYPAPRISGGGGDARQSGNALADVMKSQTAAELLMKRRAPFLFG